MKTLSLDQFIRMARAIAILWTAAAPYLGSSATLVVTTTGDNGAGSLRQAISSANASANVSDVIQFNIAGAGPHTISPATPLPALTDPVVIDGYTQPGASANSLASGDNAVLRILVLERLLIDTSNSTVRGLAIRQIQIGQMPGPKGGNVVEGCFVGLDTSGTNSLASPGSGVFVQTPNNRIGGTAPAARNLISGKGATGIEVFESFATNNVIQGNYIGTDRTGTRAIGNEDRALVVNQNASRTTIGGEVPGAGNLISGNLNRGITLDGSSNVVQGNFIGTDVTGVLPLGNARTGVEIGGTGNIVGGTRSGAGNVIAFNGVDGQGATTNGVDVKSGTTVFTILGNSIFDNRGLGIDVGMNGLVTPGFPVLTVVSNTGTATAIRGTHTPNVTFLLELFTNPTADPSGNGEGKTLLVSTNIATDGSGNFTINWPVALAPGLFLTATANGNTEFSQARIVAAPSGPNSWTRATDGKWETGANWSLNVAPFSGQPVISITNAGTKTVTSDATTANGFPSTLTISNLVLGAPSGVVNTLSLAHGGTGTPLRILRGLSINRGGAMVINNSALQIDGPADAPVSLDGALTLNSGVVQMPAIGRQIYIGHNGPGALTVSGGQLTVPYAIVGLNAGANGLWHIAGGSNVVANTFDIADNLTATGAVRVAGGSLTVPGAYIGLFGNGRLSVSNGTFQCAGTALIASQPGAQGNFTAAGGTSTFNNILISESSSATGSVLVTGTALVRVNGELDNRGTVTVAGGDLNVLGQLDSANTNSMITVTGGRFAATNDNAFLNRVTVTGGSFVARDVFLANNRSFGTLTLGGSGVVSLPRSFNGFSVGVNGGTGVVSQVGGEMQLANTDLNIGGLFSPAVGRMTLSDGLVQARRVFVGGQGGGSGTLTMTGGTMIVSNLAVNATSQFALNGGTVQSSGTTVNNGQLFAVGSHVLSPATLNLLGGNHTFPNGLVIQPGAALTGVGTIMATVGSSSVIAPGNPIGRLNFSSTLTLSNGTELRFDLGGYTPTTQHDFIGVTGALAAFGGRLSVRLVNGFETTITNGAAFTVLTAASINGAFVNVASGARLATADGSGDFLVTYTGGNLRLSDFRRSGAGADTDGDGLPDAWEDLYGLNKNNPADAALDLDGDRASNLNEFRAGTVPNNANSVFRIISIRREAGDVRITWNTVGGKSYRVQTNSSLTSNFGDFSPLITVNGSGESTTNFLHVGGFNGPARYYRIRLGP